jgi:hypothetical protein
MSRAIFEAPITLPYRSPDRRDSEGDVQQLSVLAVPDGLDVLQWLAAQNLRENLVLLLAIRRY